MRNDIFRQNQLIQISVSIDTCFGGRLLCTLHDNVTRDPSPNVYRCDPSDASTHFLQGDQVWSRPFRSKIGHELPLYTDNQTIVGFHFWIRGQENAWNKSFILHPSMSVAQSKGLERIYLVSACMELNFGMFCNSSCLFHILFCLLWIVKARAKDKKDIWISVRWKAN